MRRQRSVPSGAPTEQITDETGDFVQAVLCGTSWKPEGARSRVVEIDQSYGIKADWDGSPDAGHVPSPSLDREFARVVPERQDRDLQL
jgi:hypothetical protein